ncbi:response regulator transcription factor [Clostridium botulinum]|uniref:Stage 0 sporulation protein A homolog n=1 Tax=Clostridium botulinum (strain Langeland / NCTC 10281 / Type F) TaxID=441772 RepID=A7G9Z8_CLOBL|nr:response regulator transcription factor [Clostridium botulinum]ABS41910.1 DNA-binding response regulator [Clostridium botulinum F str. Langeland]ADF98079.1 DNA-binding response regulator [Clostridium botulinum F str. 230613]KKM41562.1 transcriptional regulator [Clostridium botulinum]MBY6792747.1 response regulator transcription factor [Clostridium botulinum]MBY6938394.1 response regulator transcription factor [Clostridium botulinum]
MNNTYKLLIIEDDKNMCEVLSNLLNKWEFEVNVCKDFEKVIECFLKYKPDVVLMDINLPVCDGFYWCKKIRQISKTPIIFVSSRDSNMEIVMAINNGGDDFIQKPFNSEVLIAKLQAIIRRTYEYKNEEAKVLKCDDLLLNLDNATLLYNEKSLELTKNEMLLLKTLMENKGKGVSRSKLMKKLWDDDIYVNENTLTVNINRLRNRLEKFGIKDLIVTKKGIGYIIL